MGEVGAVVLVDGADAVRGDFDAEIQDAGAYVKTVDPSPTEEETEAIQELFPLLAGMVKWSREERSNQVNQQALAHMELGTSMDAHSSQIRSPLQRTTNLLEQ